MICTGRDIGTTDFIAKVFLLVCVIHKSGKKKSQNEIRIKLMPSNSHVEEL